VTSSAPAPSAVDVQALQAERDKLLAERDAYRELYLRALEQCRKLELGLLGQKSERLPPSEAQLSIAILSTLLTNAAPETAAPPGEPRSPDEPAPPGEPQSPDGPSPSEPSPSESQPSGTDPSKKKRPKPVGRRPLPATLPRVEIELLPPEVEREGRDAFDCIGAEVSETVERRRASLVVVRVTRPKFVRKDRIRNDETQVVTAAPPELPIDRGLAGPGLLADTIVKRWWESMPLYRLESVYARDGLELDRSTICTWHRVLARLIARLVAAMREDAQAAPYWATDATGVLVQAKNQCHRGHIWVVIAPQRHILFHYTRAHDGPAVDEVLKGYKGNLLADAHTVFDHLYRLGLLIEFACWAHARRYFVKAHDTEPDLARQALALIGELFRIERTVETALPDQRLAARQSQAAPVVTRFFAWCDQHAATVLDATPIAKAIGYARNQREALSRFLTDGHVPIHNNGSENALRVVAVGRKNWLFLGNDRAGETYASFLSLLASCRLHGIEPWAYLRDLFCLLPSWPAHRVLELAPLHWKQTLQHQDTQQRLAANLFRAVTLDFHRPNL
jgi:transposase